MFPTSHIMCYYSCHLACPFEQKTIPAEGRKQRKEPKSQSSNLSNLVSEPHFSHQGHEDNITYITSLMKDQKDVLHASILAWLPPRAGSEIGIVTEKYLLLISAPNSKNIFPFISSVSIL